MSPREKLRVLVLEDEWVARNFLVEMIEATGIATVVGALATFDEAASFIRAAEPSSIDVVFVDIKLAGSSRDGFDLVRSCIKQPCAPAFVLATALRNHAIEAFELGVVDYVLKPFERLRITSCLERLAAARNVAARPAARRPARIIARNKRALVFLTLDEVWALEAAEGLTLVHSGRGTFDVDLSLDTIAASFGEEFLRVHRNWLVSELHILELEREGGEAALLVGSRAAGASTLRVPVARDRAGSLRARLVDDGIGIRRR